MKFYKYTPALLDPKTLEDTLIGRDIELNNIKRILKSASAGKSLSHAILIGPKGIGKTHVLRIIYYAIKGELKTKGLNAYKEKFIPVIFSGSDYSEIQYDIDKLWYLKEAIPEFKGDDEICVACQREDYDVALEIINKALKNNPNNVKKQYQQGCIYIRLKQYAKAIEAHKKVIELKPDKHEAWCELGISYNHLKRYEEAIEAYKKAIEIKPDEHQPWCNIGSIYRRLKKYSDALKILTEAIKLKPDCDFTLNNLLGIYKIIYLNEGIKGNIGSASKNLKGLLNLVGYTSKKDRIYDFLIASLKKMIANKKIDLIKTTLTEIEETKQIDLLRLLSPYSTFIKYLETKDKEIIDRLRHEERIVVEDMLKMIEEDKSERKVKKAVQEETK